ncbi:32367_t:CDS:2, partial [Gigaspora margarita]
VRSEFEYDKWWFFQKPERKSKMIMEVLVKHDRLKNWEKLKGEESIENITLENSNTRKVKEEFKTQSPNSLALKLQCKPISKKRSKREWVIVDENKENQPIIGRVMTKRTHITDIICYESSSKNEKQTGKSSSNKMLQERLSNGVKKARTKKLIDISLWVKYTKGEMNLQLEPDYFVKREKGSSISLEQVRSLQSRKEEIGVVIEEPTKEEGEVDVPTRVKWVMTEDPPEAGEPKELETLFCSNEEAYIKEELRQKDKIAVGLDKLREVFIPRDIKEYEEQHLEWLRGFLADKIGLSLERMNVSKNKARDIAKNIGITRGQKRKGTKKREEKRREPEGKESINPEMGTGEKEIVPNDKNQNDARQKFLVL